MESLQEKKWFIIRAYSKGIFEISEGDFKLFNKMNRNQIKIELNDGDSYILFTETKVKITYSSTLELEELLYNPIPSDWAGLKVDIQPVLKNRILVLGASDSGKTTLIKYLFYNLPKKNQTIGILDLDVGQNSIGLPGTINLASLTNVSETLTLKSSAFFGHVSPAGNSQTYIQAVNVFYKKVEKFNFNWLLVDTLGYIQTPEALEIQKRVIRIINPQVVILLGKEGKELEKKLFMRTVRFLQITSAIEGIKKEKKPELRRNKRKERFDKYFENSKNIELPIEKIKSIIIHFDRDYRELTAFEEINYFIHENERKLKNSFIGLQLNNEENPIYGKILNINQETIEFIVQIDKDVSNKFIILIGSIVLE